MANPVKPLLHEVVVNNVGTDCDSTYTVDSEGVLFYYTPGCGATKQTTFADVLEDIANQIGILQRSLLDVLVMQGEVKARFGNGKSK